MYSFRPISPTPERVGPSRTTQVPLGVTSPYSSGSSLPTARAKGPGGRGSGFLRHSP
jgi:hypothetical protein